MSKMSWLFQCGRECSSLGDEDNRNDDGGLLDVSADVSADVNGCRLIADGDDGDEMGSCSSSSSGDDGEDSVSEDGSDLVSPRDASTMEVNYDEIVPPLFAYMQNRQWKNVVEEAESDPSQARYWVYRFQRDDRTRIRWRMLPCHAAVIFRCPPHVLRAVVEGYPEGCAQFDDQGHLPIHLAYKNKLAFRDNETLGILLGAYPKGVITKDGKGRVPNDYVNKRSRCSRSRGSRYGDASYDEDYTDDDASESDYSDMDVMSYFSDFTEDSADSCPRPRKIPPPPPPRRKQQQWQPPEGEDCGEEVQEEATTASTEERLRIARLRVEEEDAAEREREAAANRAAAKLAAKEVLDELALQRKRDAAEKKRALAERKKAEKRLAAEGKKKAQLAKEAEKTKRRQEEAERKRLLEEEAERKKLRGGEAERKKRQTDEANRRRRQAEDDAASAAASVEERQRQLAKERRRQEEAEERRRRRDEKREAAIARVVTQEAEVEASVAASVEGHSTNSLSASDYLPRDNVLTTVESASTRNDGGNMQKGNAPPPAPRKKSTSSTSPPPPVTNRPTNKQPKKWKRTLSLLRTRSGKAKGPGKTSWDDAPSPCNTVDSYDMDQSVAATT